MSCKMKEVAMDKVLYNAAVKGNKSFLTDAGDEYLLGKNQQNNHIVHIAVRHERLEFIQEAVKRFPQLISEANGDGDNPLHLAAQTGNLNIMKVLVESYKAQTQGQSDDTKPWRIQNEEGNTPLHVALINHHITVALFLVEQDGPELARICNNFLETPLHLAIKHRVDDDVKAVGAAMKLVWEKLGNYEIGRNTPCNLEKSSMCVIEMLLQKEHLVACWRDKEGLTPLLRATKLCPSYLPAIKSIVEHCPESVEVCDASGKTLLHLINKLPKCVDYKELLYSNPQVMALKNHQDKDGNTPTHIALDNQNMDLFLVLLNSGVSLTVTSNEGVSLTDLIKLKSDPDFWNLFKYEQSEMIGSLLSDDKKIQLSHNEIKDAIDATDIKFVRERIEKDGSSFLHTKYDGDNNILHLLMRNGWKHVLESTEFTNLVKTILDKLPCLICERDDGGYGKTPLHWFVKVSPEMVNQSFLEMIKNYFERAKTEATTIEELCYDPPWKTKDEWDDTPLHMILDFPYEAKWIRCARQIIEFDPTLKYEVNEYGQNPLHLLSELRVSRDQLTKDGVWEDVESMVKDLADAHEMRDEDGLTPFLTAAKEKNLDLLTLICGIDFAVLVENQVDHDDNNFWHLLADMEVSNDLQAHTFLFRKFPRPVNSKNPLVNQNKNGDTPLHIAIQNDSFQIAHSFIKIFIDFMPGRREETQKVDDVLNKCNNDGNTPFHLVAGKSNLPDADKFIKYALDNYSSQNTHFVGMLNKERNTPLHLAISKGDLELARLIIDHAMKSSSWIKYVDVVSIRNNEGNTALHLAISKGDLELGRLIIHHAMKSSSWVKYVDVVSIRNNEGNTALHLAISKGDSELAEFIIEQAMKSSSRVEDVHVVNIRNKEGNTALHLAISKGNLELAKFIIDHAMKSSSGVKYVDVVSIRDNEGNTALHLATLKDHFYFAMSLIKGAMDTKCLDKILEIPNNQNKTPNHLIASSHTTSQFERFIWENSDVMDAMLRVPSFSGISAEKITDHVNTMGVIAGLLATITFTAAFSTPGGLNSENGTPILMKKMAFKVFMILDILALCLSMLVLFSLLWIMNTGPKRNQVAVLDRAVLLLRGAFYATILTFMMGVFVTVYPLSHWIAIWTCVVCSLLVIVTNTWLTIQPINPFSSRVSFWSKLFGYINQLRTCPNCLTKNRSHQEESGNYGQANQQIASPPPSCEP